MNHKPLNKLRVLFHAEDLVRDRKGDKWKRRQANQRQTGEGRIEVVAKISGSPVFLDQLGEQTPCLRCELTGKTLPELPALRKHFAHEKKRDPRIFGLYPHVASKEFAYLMAVGLFN